MKFSVKAFFVDLHSGLRSDLTAKTCWAQLWVALGPLLYSPHLLPLGYILRKRFVTFQCHVDNKQISHAPKKETPSSCC